eukprot:5032703-Alexandrium_andersonii.AAC.1
MQRALVTATTARPTPLHTLVPNRAPKLLQGKTRTHFRTPMHRPTWRTMAKAMLEKTTCFCAHPSQKYPAP